MATATKTQEPKNGTATPTLAEAPTPKLDPGPVPGADAGLHAKLAYAQATMPTLGRNKTADVETKSGGSYSYSYITEAAIMETVRQHLAPLGVSIAAEPEDFTIDDNGVIVCWVSIKLTDGLTGTVMSFRFPGVGSDKGDKALGKAITSATRQGLLKLFLQGGEVDDKEHEAGDQPARRSGGSGRSRSGGRDTRPASEGQCRRVFGLGREHGLTPDQVRLVVRYVTRDETPGGLAVEGLDRTAVQAVFDYLEQRVASAPQDAYAEVMAWSETQGQQSLAPPSGAPPLDDPHADPSIAGGDSMFPHADDDIPF